MIATWRRVLDWKSTVTLVDLADVEPALLKVHRLVPPEAKLSARFPRLAELAAMTRFARVERALAKVLHEAGVPTYEIGYHRGSDGLLFAEESRFGRKSRDVDMAHLVEKLLNEVSDDTHDRVRTDAVDAVLRIFSEGLLTERAVIIAALVPPLSARDELTPGEDALEGFEALDPSGLPDVAPEFVDRVAHVWSEIESSPPTPPGPQLPPDVRRAYQRKAAVVGLIALALGLVGLAYAPALAVLALPVVVVCTLVVAVHALVLRAQKP